MKGWRGRRRHLTWSRPLRLVGCAADPPPHSLREQGGKTNALKPRAIAQTALKQRGPAGPSDSAKKEKGGGAARTVKNV